MAEYKSEYKRIQLDGIYYYGKHLLVTANNCNDSVRDEKQLALFLKDLVVKIDMVAFGDPIVERFGSGIEVGISAVQLIETSAVTLHTNDMAKDLYLDVFSCKSFSEEIVLSVLKKMFSPQNITFQVILR